MTLPRLALSVRQPWAWALIHAGKNIENRIWRRPNPAMTQRGVVAIHASSGMTRAEYEDVRDWIAERPTCLTPPHTNWYAVRSSAQCGSSTACGITRAAGGPGRSAWCSSSRRRSRRSPVLARSAFSSGRAGASPCARRRRSGCCRRARPRSDLSMETCSHEQSRGP